MTLGVMVDLGWPWWVSTAIALTVAAVCAVVFVRTRRRDLKGATAILIVQGLAMAVLAPFLMGGNGSGGAMTPGMAGASSTGAMEAGEGMGMGAGTMTGTSSSTSLPFSFFLTRYEFLGDPDNPEAVRYHSDGTPLAKAADGSTVILSGKGSWDPYSGLAVGDGTYVISDAAGKVAARGKWRATRFVSFRQLSGFWGFPIREEAWQGPPGSASFSGFLQIRVRLDGRGKGVLTAWCAMPENQKAAGRAWDGITLVGPKLRFTDFKPNEGRLEGGVMFYGPGSGT